jgi:hypothetical protein
MTLVCIVNGGSLWQTRTDFVLLCIAIALISLKQLWHHVIAMYHCSATNTSCYGCTTAYSRYQQHCLHWRFAARNVLQHTDCSCYRQRYNLLSTRVHVSGTQVSELIMNPSCRLRLAAVIVLSASSSSLVYIVLDVLF